MDDKKYIPIKEMAKLIAQASHLKLGEQKVVIAHTIQDDNSRPVYNFTSQEPKITGQIMKIPSKNSKLQNFFEHFRQQLESLGKSETDLNYYIDDKGRQYSLDKNNLKIYHDERGFDYYLDYDENGQEHSWCYLSDQTRAYFLDANRQVIIIDDKAYPVLDNMVIDYEHPLDYIGFKR